MTIAAGFVCADGIVLCADSQETISGYIKLNQGKINVSLLAPNRAIAIVGSGHSDYIDTAIENILHPYFEANDLGEVGSIFEERLLAFFDKSLSRWSGFSEQERPMVELLIAVSLRNTCRLFHYSGTAFHSVDAKAIGTGILLANNLVQKYYRQDQTVDQVAALGTYILGKVKNGVDGCGGFTEIVLMKQNGMIAYPSTNDIEALEREHERIEKDATKKIGADIADKTFANLSWHNRESIIEANKKGK